MKNATMMTCKAHGGVGNGDALNGSQSEASIIGSSDATNGIATIAHLRQKIMHLEMDVDALKAERVVLKQHIADLLQKELAL